MGVEKTIVHVTHEAAAKVGGIGTVLEGLFTSQAYLSNTDRSIVIGPLFNFDGPISKRFDSDFEVLFSSRDSIFSSEYNEIFKSIEKGYHVKIIYGIRNYTDPHSGTCSKCETLLFDTRSINRESVDFIKKNLFEHYNIKSDRYENIWEYEQYVRIAPVAIAVLKEILSEESVTTVISHEFMGMATALTAKLDPNLECSTVFYAHEVATIRNIVEKHSGHDTMFYNILEYANENKFYIDEIFGDQSHYFKHPLVEASKYLDYIFAVGDYVADELRFLAPEFADANIKVVYNGIPAYKISYQKKMHSKSKLQNYCRNLLGFSPDHIFTHVTRLVDSKGLWRDMTILEKVDKHFREQNKTGCLFLLSTQTAQKSTEEILGIESKYGWPAAHREGWPDLNGGEADLYTKIQQFNARCFNIKVIFVNQFGFCPKCCGNNMPDDIRFTDIRRGTDYEFGLSVYEPFGISHLEPLTFGGICIISNVSGCTGFVGDVTGGEYSENVIVGNFVDLQESGCDRIENLVDINGAVRGQIEDYVGSKISEQIISSLSDDQAVIEQRIERGYELAKKMSWEAVVGNYLLPCFEDLRAGKLAVSK